MQPIDRSRVNRPNRAQSFGVASGRMRRIPLDLWRVKRDGPAGHLPMDGDSIFSSAQSTAPAVLDDALQDLAKLAARRTLAVCHLGGVSEGKAFDHAAPSPEYDPPELGFGQDEAQE